MTDDNTQIRLRFSISVGGSQKYVENVTETWGEMLERLAHSRKEQLPWAKFKELSEDRRGARKARTGYFVGAQFKNGIRHKGLMSERQLITFDIDKGTPRLLIALETGTSGLGDLEYAVYSTHSHGFGDIKLRVVLPLSKRLPKDQFMPLSRILAHKIDPRMATVDPVSFRPAQVMYWPVHCEDVEPVFFRNKGAMLDPDAVLAEWGDWHDLASLPSTPGEQQVREPLAKGADPTTKRGPVGAFCRTYDVRDAIAKFLDDVYTPSVVDAGVPQRYTYTPGKGVNGAVVYDDGKKFHSHHGSDPVSDQNVNSFDLVRIHLFGDQDKSGHLSREDQSPTDMPSYKAMVAFLRDDPAVSKELVESNYPGDDDDYWDDADAGVPEPADGPRVKPATTPAAPSQYDAPIVLDAPDGPDWKSKLDLDENGRIKNTFFNLAAILRNDGRLRGTFGHDTFIDDIVLRRTLRFPRLGFRLPGPDKRNPIIPVSENHVSCVRTILSAPPARLDGDKADRRNGGYGLRVGSQDVRDAIDQAASLYPCHPVRAYLDWLPAWDGVPRIERLWIAACHTPDTPYHRQTARNLLVASVARIYEPGCKFDFLPVLQGPEGIRKTTLVHTLGGVWAGESPGHFDDLRKMVEATRGYWFIENAEMRHFRRADNDDSIKASISSRHERMRLAYRRDEQTVARQFVQIGTTNDPFLRTKQRRVWPIQCTKRIDTDWIEANRDQLFAEACAVYHGMREDKPYGDLPLYLDDAASEELYVQQEEHLLPNAAEAHAGILSAWLETAVAVSQAMPGADIDDGDAFMDEKKILRVVTCAIELHEKALGRERGRYSTADARSIGDAMKLVPNWHKGTMLHCGTYNRQKTYRRIGGTDNDL